MILPAVQYLRLLLSITIQHSSLKLKFLKPLHNFFRLLSHNRRLIFLKHLLLNLWLLLLILPQLLFDTLMNVHNLPILSCLFLQYCYLFFKSFDVMVVFVTTT